MLIMLDPLVHFSFYFLGVFFYYSLFTLFCQFLLYRKVTQSCIYMYMYIYIYMYTHTHIYKCTYMYSCVHYPSIQWWPGADVDWCVSSHFCIQGHHFDSLKLTYQGWSIYTVKISKHYKARLCFLFIMFP